VKRRPEAATSTSSDSGLPSELAAGPDPDLWCPADLVVPSWMDDEAGRRELRAFAASRNWRDAGERWGAEQGLGHRQWMELLPADVGYAVSARGRLHIATGQAPWEHSGEGV